MHQPLPCTTISQLTSSTPPLIPPPHSPSHPPLPYVLTAPSPTPLRSSLLTAPTTPPSPLPHPSQASLPHHLYIPPALRTTTPHAVAVHPQTGPTPCPDRSSQDTGLPSGPAPSKSSGHCHATGGRWRKWMEPDHHRGNDIRCTE